MYNLVTRSYDRLAFTDLTSYNKRKLSVTRDILLGWLVLHNVKFPETRNCDNIDTEFVKSILTFKRRTTMQNNKGAMCCHAWLNERSVIYFYFKLLLMCSLSDSSKISYIK